MGMSLYHTKKIEKHTKKSWWKNAMTISHEYEQTRFFSKKVIPKHINVFFSIFVCFKMIKIVYNIKRAKI